MMSQNSRFWGRNDVVTTSPALRRRGEKLLLLTFEDFSNLSYMNQVFREDGSTGTADGKKEFIESIGTGDDEIETNNNASNGNSDGFDNGNADGLSKEEATPFTSPIWSFSPDLPEDIINFGGLTALGRHLLADRSYAQMLNRTIEYPDPHNALVRHQLRAMHFVSELIAQRRPTKSRWTLSAAKLTKLPQQDGPGRSIGSSSRSNSNSSSSSGGGKHFVRVALRHALRAIHRQSKIVSGEQPLLQPGKIMGLVSLVTELFSRAHFARLAKAVSLSSSSACPS